MKCRHCEHPLETPFLDLGYAPASNAYLSADQLSSPENWFPLRLSVCPQCWLAQTEDYTSRESLFTEEYAYFSSFSPSWLAHAKRYVEMITRRLALDKQSQVVEVAANDGYLLQYFQPLGIPAYGIEPTASTAQAACDKGIEIVPSFFGSQLAQQLVQQGKQADLIIANNVLAHVPDINDFVNGFNTLLKPEGVATFEFPHLLRLIEQSQFDTVYHEHYSYLSLTAVQTVFATQGLAVFDVEELSTHGGSLRVYAQHKTGGQHAVSDHVDKILNNEIQAGIRELSFYHGLQQRALKIKNDLLKTLIELKEQGLNICAYGAAAKGNTLLNLAGIRADLLPFVVDKNPEKQNKYLPGSHIPIVDESWILRKTPDCILILPWNLKEEIMEQLAYVRDWDARFLTAIPTLEWH